MPTDFQLVYEHATKFLPRLATANTSAIHGWLDAGCDPHKDILPTITRLTEKNPNAGSFSYFTQAVVRAKLEREAAMPKAHHYEIKPEDGDEDARRAKRIASAVRKYNIRNPEHERWLAGYEAKHGRVEV